MQHILATYPQSFQGKGPLLWNFSGFLPEKSFQALDRVWHHRLLQKLSKILPPLFKVQTSYMQNKKFKVKGADVIRSMLGSINSGVPQVASYDQFSIQSTPQTCHYPMSFPVLPGVMSTTSVRYFLPPTLTTQQSFENKTFFK